jgi:hypothetical protein
MWDAPASGAHARLMVDQAALLIPATPRLLMACLILLLVLR